MTIILEETILKEKRSNEIELCHYVPYKNAPKSMCGLDRSTICLNCPLEDYYGTPGEGCRCGLDTCPLCRLAFEGFGND